MSEVLKEAIEIEMNRQVRLIAAFIALLSVGCARVKPSVKWSWDQRAVDLALTAREFNHNITSAKGKGWIDIDNKKFKDRFKIAWAASEPDKVRIVLMESGYPLQTLLADGKFLKIVSHINEKQTYKIAVRDSNLERILGVPVYLSEIIYLLLGRIPVEQIESFDRILMDSTADQVAHRVILSKNANSLTKYIQWNSKGNIKKVYVSNKAAKKIYEIRFMSMKVFDDMLVPDKFFIHSPEKGTIIITITDFIANPSLKEDVFK